MMTMRELERIIGIKKSELLKELIWTDSQIKRDDEDIDELMMKYSRLYSTLVDGLNIEQEDIVDTVIDEYSHLDG